MGQGRPQQPELNRSGTTPLQPDSLESELDARKQQRPGQGDEPHGVPEDNRPGHNPEQEQDKPDPDDFVARFSNPGTATNAATTDGDPPAGDAPPDTHPLVAVTRDLAQRIRDRDLVGLATFPVRAGFRLIRHYQPLPLGR